MSLMYRIRRTRYLMRIKASFLGINRWRWAVLIPDELENTIIVKKPWWAFLRTLNLAFRPAQVTALEVHLQSLLMRDGLLPWLIGGLTGAKVPVLRLVQTTELHGTQEAYLRAARPGRAGYLFTRYAALDVADFLRRRGYSGPLPDLNDDERWRVPVATAILTMVIAVAATLLCVGVYVAILLSASGS